MTSNRLRLLTIISTLIVVPSATCLLASTIHPLHPIDRNPITQITLEHGGCFGACPVYTVTITPNNLARYEGKSYAPRQGTFTGQTWGWQCLVKSFDNAGFDHLSPPTEQIVDAEQITITTTRHNGATKRIAFTPTEDAQPLWELEQIVDGSVTNVHWKPVPPRPTSQVR